MVCSLILMLFSIHELPSTVTIEFKKVSDSTTDVHIKQTGIPTRDEFGNRGVEGEIAFLSGYGQIRYHVFRILRPETVVGGWKERILGGMKKFLGYLVEDK